VGEARETELLELAERVAGWARDGEEIEAYLARTTDTEIRAFEGAVESLSSADSEGIGIRVIAGGRQGFAYAGTLALDVLEETLAEARDNSGFGTFDEWSGLAIPDEAPVAPLDLYVPGLAGFPTEGKVDLALELERATRAADHRIRGVETAEYGDAVIEAAIANNLGVAASARRTVCSVYAYAMAGEGDDTQTGYGYSVARSPEDLDVAKAAGDAARRATGMLGARKPRSGRLTVIFDPLVTASFLGVLSSALSGEATQKGRSMFAGREGQQVAVGSVTLVDDPTMAEAYGASTYDAEGLACRRNVVIDNGTLVGFLHNSYTGRRAGTLSNGCASRGGFKTTPGVGSRALALAPGRQSQDELMAEIDQGLLVQSVTGLHSGANPVSGVFSVGVEGRMVRGGAPAEPVREATIASTIGEMLHQVTAVGSDTEWLPGPAAGVSLVISDLSLSGS